MEYRRFNDKIVLRLDRDDEIVESIKAVAAKENVRLAYVSGIGGTDKASIGVFNMDKRAYANYEITGTHEITSLVGNINTLNGEIYTHLHINLAGEGGKIVGGHLFSSVICLTAEIFITIIDGTVDRKKDEDLQINKFSF